MSRPVQQLLCGMPERRAVLVAHQWEGQVLVSAGGVGLVGPYRAEDTGARNLGMVMLTQMGFGVGQVAEAFGLRPGTVSHLRTAFGRGGSAALVKTSGRPAALTEQVVAEVRRWLAAGASQQQVAERLGVTQSGVSWALRRYPAPAAGPLAAELDFSDADADADAGGSAGRVGPDAAVAASPAETGACTELVVRLAAQLGRPAASGLVRPAAGRVATGSHPSRYAGAMLAANGHNGKRGRTEKGRADTLLTDERGRAVCFTTGEPSQQTMLTP